MAFALIKLRIRLPGVHSLKEKRSRLARIRTMALKHNYSFAEIGDQDTWNDSHLGFAIVSSDGHALERQLSAFEKMLSQVDPDLMVVNIEIERV